MLSKIGTGELIVILLIALFVVGPERLPKLGKAVGKAIAGFKRYMNDVTGELKESSEEFKDIAKEFDKVKSDVTKTVNEAGKAKPKAAAKADASASDKADAKEKSPVATGEAPVAEKAQPEEQPQDTKPNGVQL